MLFFLCMLLPFWPPLISAKFHGGVALGDDECSDEAVQCCHHHSLSQQFKDCCSHFGCCPNCSGFCLQPVSKELVRRPSDYLKIYECCIHPFYSKEWHDCCNVHSCCPICDDLPKGCCYDGLLYWFGTVVESFPEVCTELVCGAMISNTSPPFITATILSLQWPPFSSDEAVCKEPQNDYCIDVEGIIRCDGCVWYYESPCQRCQCENGIIKCDNVTVKAVQCPPAPIGYCVPVPGPCCPTWDCPQLNHLYGRSHFIGCIDKLGHQHDLGEIWADSGNPCFNLTCTTAGIIESDHLPCPPLTHPPHTACILEEEDCCNIWKCPNCVDEDEAERDVGEVWQHPTNTCLVLECTTAGIMEKWITCPSPPPQPSPQCVLVMGEECCLTWLCPECVDDKDNTHSLDETWADPTNPCTVMVCKRDGPRRIPKQLCPPLPPQSPSYQHCRLTVVDCCPTWNCSLVCPEVDLNINCVQIFNQCFKDNDCPDDSMCCPGACGLVCVQDAIHTRNSCPDPQSFQVKCVQSRDQCVSDSECGPGGQCCLVANCGKECIAV